MGCYKFYNLYHWYSFKYFVNGRKKLKLLVRNEFHTSFSTSLLNAYFGDYFIPQSKLFFIKKVYGTQLPQKKKKNKQFLFFQSNVPQIVFFPHKKKTFCIRKTVLWQNYRHAQLLPYILILVKTKKLTEPWPWTPQIGYVIIIGLFFEASCFLAIKNISLLLSNFDTKWWYFNRQASNVRRRKETKFNQSCMWYGFKSNMGFLRFRIHR